MEQLLLHVCCGPDLTYAYEYFSCRYNVTAYFANDNIETESEYEKRFEQAYTVAKSFSFNILKKNYEKEKYLFLVKGFEKHKEQSERCEICHRMNIENTLLKAQELKIKFVSTTLTVSPRKNSDIINRVGEECAQKRGVEFLKENLKKNSGFQKSVEMSKKLNLYRQNWCGCKYSRGEIG